MEEPIRDAEALSALPPSDQDAVDVLWRNGLEKLYRKIVVLDDDPTGVQTVHGVHVYTDWSKACIESGFREENKLFYLLTNSRGMTADQSAAAHREIARRVWEAGRLTGKEFLLMSRSDSTLRGHFPLETATLRETIFQESGEDFHGEVFCPFFPEGGRYTLDNIHYVKEGGRLVPAARTEFAKDVTFGYHASDLREYVEEKTQGRYPAKEVTCISLESLRAMDIDRITKQLLAVSGFGKIVVNAAAYDDLKVFSAALCQALAQGRRFLFRTAASLVKVLGGMTDRPLLRREEMIVTGMKNGGLIVVGSHTEKTTGQLRELELSGLAELLEFDSDLVLKPGALEAEAVRVAARCTALIAAGRTAAVYTKRKLLTAQGDTPEQALLRSVKISEAVASVVRRLEAGPSFLLAKGGITSSDVGLKGLGVKKALVLGQAASGVPVWYTGEESRFPHTPYVIFPGNVGGAHVLREVVEKMTGCSHPGRKE